MVLSTRALSEEEVDDLHRRGDCYLSLSRGEGWGLGAFDAAAWGNPVIVTGWGAAAEFLPDGYPYFVDYDLIATTSDEPDALWRPCPEEHWAKARVSHAARLLRHVYENRDEARAWGRLAQTHVSANFSSITVTGRLMAALEFTAANCPWRTRQSATWRAGPGTEGAPSIRPRRGSGICRSWDK